MKFTSFEYGKKKVLRKKFKFEDPDLVQDTWYRYRYEDSYNCWYGSKNTCTLWNSEFAPGKITIRPCYAQPECVELTVVAENEDDDEVEFVWSLPTEVIIKVIEELGYCVERTDW